jgi:hypothetical protein
MDLLAHVTISVHALPEIEVTISSLCGGHCRFATNGARARFVTSTQTGSMSMSTQRLFDLMHAIPVVPCAELKSGNCQITESFQVPNLTTVRIQDRTADGKVSIQQLHHQVRRKGCTHILLFRWSWPIAAVVVRGSQKVELHLIKRLPTRRSPHSAFVCDERLVLSWTATSQYAKRVSQQPATKHRVRCREEAYLSCKR